VVLRKQDAIYLQPARVHALDASERTVRDLNVLLNFSKSLNAVRGLAALQQKRWKRSSRFPPPTESPYC